MASCEKNAINSAPVSPSLPGDNDLVWFTLPDGTTIFRKWSTMKAAGIPDDAEFETQVSGSNTNNFVNGNTIVFLTNFVGKRIRVYRGSVPQSTQQGQFTWDKAISKLIVSPAPVAGEFWLIQGY